MHDYHMHSRWCRHASGTPAEYAAAAEARGIDEICFTPHIPLPGYRPGFFNDRIRMDISEFDSYLEELEQARRAFPGLTILSGIEADYVRGMEKFLEGFLAERGFDFVLMSVHFVHGWPGDTWVYDLPRDRSLETVYRDYFSCMREGIATGLFDSVAHLDLVKQPELPLLESVGDEVARTLALCRDQGVCMEVNASGARKKVAECYPGPAIVALAVEEGVHLTPGSDAHSPDQVGSGFELYADGRAGTAGGCFARYSRRMRLSEPAADQAFCSTKLR